jgi:peroxiredoxin
MTYSRTKLGIWIVAVALAVGIMAICIKKPHSAPANDPNQTAQQQPVESNTTEKPPAPSVIAPPKLTINDIIKYANTWNPIFTKSYGKEAPDFTVIDINGKKHTLSDYKGKNVMLVLWETWCPPCIAEIPSIIELRKQISEDKLIILGISFIDQRNTTEAVRKFVTKNPVINYPVTATDLMAMPSPYNLIRAFPSSFFINPQGKIKLAAEGMVPFPQMKAIIEADSTPSTSSGQVNSPQAEQ